MFENKEFDVELIKNITEVVTKGTTPSSVGFQFDDNGTVNFVKIESIDMMGNFIKEKFAHITNECDEKLKRSKLKNNDILFSIAGAIGRTAIVSEDILPANTNQALAIIRLNSNRVNVKFLNYMLNSEYVIKQYNKKKQGVAQINLSLNDISNLEVLIPPIELQNKFEKIVEQIDKQKFVNLKIFQLLGKKLKK